MRMDQTVKLVSRLFSAFAVVSFNVSASPGDLDPAFLTSRGPNDEVGSIVVQPDGKLLIGGWFTAINDTKRNSIARLNPNGSLEPTFNPGAGPGGVITGEFPLRIHSVALQGDGKVILAGDF